MLIKPYINIHTHHSPSGNEWAIVNKLDKYEEVLQPGRYSIGIHPGYITENNPSIQLEALHTYMKHENVLAIGECGLDVFSKTEPALQEKVFREQLHITKEINKPVIIHCVRLFDQTISILREMHVSVPVIFHGFNNKLSIAEKIISNGFFLSFGKAIMHERLAVVFANILDGTFFLETDDAAIGIDMIYTKAAALRKLSVDALILQLHNQTEKIFNTIIN